MPNTIGMMEWVSAIWSMAFGCAEVVDAKDDGVLDMEEAIAEDNIRLMLQAQGLAMMQAHLGKVDPASPFCPPPATNLKSCAVEYPIQHKRQRGGRPKAIRYHQPRGINH